jgi:hypothetical protein
MKLLSLLFVTIFALVAYADDNPQVVPKRYEPFQGKWRVVSMKNHDKTRVELKEIFVDVTGDKFELTGNGLPRSIRSVPQPLDFRIPESIQENPYRDLRDRGVDAINIVDMENQISVFWFVGIFKLEGDRLELAVKYRGQGLEGLHFKNFRPPSAFDQELTDGETRFVLERKKE